MNKEYKPDYVIMSQKLAGYLMMKGFRLMYLRPSTSYEGRNVFIFKNTDDLVAAITDYSNRKGKVLSD